MIYVINSELELFDLLYDLHVYGYHEYNEFAEPDKDGLSSADKFVKLPLDAIETYFGISDFDQADAHRIETDENGQEWEVEDIRLDAPLDRNKMRYIEGLSEYTQPKEKDYPIILFFEYYDTFDRSGRIKARYFEWSSLKKSRSHYRGKTRIKRVNDLWMKRYRKEREDLIEYQRKRIG